MPFGAVLSTGTVKGYSGPVTEVPNDMQARYQALHHQFVASARVVKYAHEHYPQFKLGNMICFGAAYPYTCSPDDMLEAQHQMRNMNWYCSDVQVKGEYPYYAKAFWKRNGIAIKMEPGDLEELKQGTVDFYTFSYLHEQLRGRQPRRGLCGGQYRPGFAEPLPESQ